MSGQGKATIAFLAGLGLTSLFYELNRVPNAEMEIAKSVAEQSSTFKVLNPYNQDFVSETRAEYSNLTQEELKQEFFTQPNINDSNRDDNYKKIIISNMISEKGKSSLDDVVSRSGEIGTKDILSDMKINQEFRFGNYKIVSLGYVNSENIDRPQLSENYARVLVVGLNGNGKIKNIDYTRGDVPLRDIIGP